MYSRNTSGIAVRLSQTATVEVAGADKVDCHDSHGYRIAFESNADCRLNPCILVESSATPSKLNPEVPDFHPHGWAAGPCVTRKLFFVIAITTTKSHKRSILGTIFVSFRSPDFSMLANCRGQRITKAWARPSN